MNLFQINTGIRNEYVVKSADYSIGDYQRFIRNSIQLLERESLRVTVISKVMPLAIEDKTGKIIDTKYETRYYLKSDVDKKQQKVNDVFLSEQTVTVFDQNESFGKKDEIQILDRKEDENYVLLSKEPKSNILYLKPNTYQLKQQLRAFDALRNRPAAHVKSLLELFGNPSDFEKAPFNNSFVKNWFILSDVSRDGTEEQREFVEKALNSPDFSLLEGPPGSGKTTAIIELILQFVLQNKRVLLCSATHAAIDNVFDRISERYQEHCNDHIVPVRISQSQGAVQESVRPYLLQNLVKTYKSQIKDFLKEHQSLESQQYLYDHIQTNDDYIDKIILDSANLVAGTMVGILQHPDIRNAKGKASFDVLIVDESSKVTFQDFIIPALHAKRWILVGDVKQLSPYTEDDHVSENLKDLIDEKEQNELVKQFELKRLVTKEQHAFDMKVYFTEQNAQQTAEAFQKYYKNEYDIIHIDKTLIDNSNDAFITHLNSADILICEDSPMVHQFLSKHLYVKSIFINGHLQQNTPAISRQNVLHQKKRPNHFLDTYPYEFESKSESWSEMVASKLNQSFGFRTAGTAFSIVDEELNYLIPNELDEAVQKIKRIAFPSVLEMLQNGVGKTAGQRMGQVLSDGLSADAQATRFQSLTYQHRMHPDIALTSQKHFYTESGNLKTANTIQTRTWWHYAAQEPVVKWIHNNDNTFQKGQQKIVNPTEVQDMEKELSAFLDWAARNPKQNGEKYEIALLSFYLEQNRAIYKMVRRVTKIHHAFSQFRTQYVNVLVYTVDKFQGQEADFVLLGFTKWGKNAHFNSPNRLNVALTRARFKLTLFGNVSWFQQNAQLEAVRFLADHFKSNLKF
jgi:superfamily I DNA and/or RNA helicase